MKKTGEKQQNIGETCIAYVISQYNSVSLYSIVMFHLMQSFPAKKIYKYCNIYFTYISSMSFYLYISPAILCFIISVLLLSLF